MIKLESRPENTKNNGLFPLEGRIMKTIRGMFFATIALCSYLMLTLVSPALPGPWQQEAVRQLYVVTYVDVFPNFAAEAAKTLQQFASDSRKGAGVVRFEVMRDVARQNHFSIVEVWQNQKAFDAHVAQANTKLFRERIQPMLGSPFDERLYYLLP